jgi:5-methyltetrahydrofolate--homocysteine methyltransferase
MPSATDFQDRIMAGDREGVETLTAAAINSGSSPDEIVHQYLMPAMEEVGRLYEEGEIFIPEMIMSARAMQAGMSTLRPLIVGGEVRTRGRVVIGTVQGDMHDIGKTLVSMMLQGVGFEVHDLGVDVAPARFVEAVREERPAIVGMSAMLTTTMSVMKNVIAALTEAGLRDTVKVLVGGAPLTAEFARGIGADGFTEDASAAAQLAKRIVAA